MIYFLMWAIFVALFILFMMGASKISGGCPGCTCGKVEKEHCREPMEGKN
jgi:hypothetical protein